MRAQSTTEYALIVATVALLTLLAGAMWGQTIKGWFDAVLSRILATSVA